MGFMKRMMEEEWDRGWRSVDKWVCPEHVEDDALRQLIAENATSTTCSYCSREAVEPFAAELDLVIERMTAGIRLEWASADDETVGWEGGYVGTVYDTYDLVTEVLEGPLNHATLINDVVGALPDQAWAQRDYYRLRPHQRLQLSWEEFARLVKHRRRYFFSDELSEDGDDDPDVHAPAVMFPRIGDVIRDAGLLRTLETGKPIFRIRSDATGRAFTAATELGTARLEFLRSSGRMAPAGIPIFYGAFDEDTAIVEARHANPTAKSYSLGAFELRRDALVVDLSQPREVPSLFDERLGHLRSAIIFLNFFAEIISHPYRPDGRIHIEYVPTQVLTEWIRSIFDPQTDEPVVGVLYKSARHPGGKNVAFFIDNAGACDQPDDTPDNPSLLVLRAARQIPPAPRRRIEDMRERLNRAYRALRGWS